MKPTSQAAVLFVRGDGKMNELTISLDPHRKTPLYEQIYGFIREEIRGGRIRAGERLPSARALSGRALYFGLSVGEPEYRGSGV
jgi:GntR family transcriptional regulator/MocR family aminotransferase